jgi:hypothetical protein
LLSQLALFLLLFASGLTAADADLAVQLLDCKAINIFQCEKRVHQTGAAVDAGNVQRFRRNFSINIHQRYGKGFLKILAETTIIAGFPMLQNS